MEVPDPDHLTKTGLFLLAKEKPVRPLKSAYLLGLGFTTIALAGDVVFQGFRGNLAAAAAAAGAAILAIWISIAFLWHSVVQMNNKIDALIRLVEKKND